MNTNHQIKAKQIIPGIILLFLMSFFCVLIYKAQIANQLDKSVVCTLKPMHKANDNYVVELTAEHPSAAEVFTCTVPNLKRISLETTGVTLSKETTVLISLADADTGEVYYQNERKLSKIAKKGSTKHCSIKLGDGLPNSENRIMILSVQLVNAGDTCIRLTANSKPGIVSSFNGDTNNHDNIIYKMRYADNTFLKPMYVIFCAALLLFLCMAYFLIVILKLPVSQFFFPVVLCLGFIVQCVIPVYGAPDEPWHMDTAYKYSNKILMIDDTGTPGTIYKRRCDVITSDQLANDVETNSYYQMLYHTFESAGDTELIEVSYSDSSNLVPGVIYLPTALGLSIGRLLGFSSMLTYQLARIFNLLAFALLSGCAVRLIPYGKNLLACLSMLPIALQQGASASYDAVINGILFLFISICLRMKLNGIRAKWEPVVCVCTAVFTALIKGGAYAPLLLLLLMFCHKPKERPCRKKTICILVSCICCIAVLCGLLIKIRSTLERIMLSDQTNVDGEALFSLSWLMEHPLNGIYVYWNTLIESGVGDNHLRGMLGGILGWHNIKPSWLFVIFFLGCLLLFLHTNEDRYEGSRRQKLLFLAVGTLSICLIMMSMLFACTSVNSSHIQGLQGRYYLALCPLFCFPITTTMIRVNKRQCRSIWIAFLFAELLLLSEILPLVL